VQTPIDSRNAQQFYDGALLRIRRFMLGIAGLGARWLESMVDALGERITTGHSSERGGVLVLRAVLRYVSIAVAAYVIFKVSRAGLYGFLAGVCLPIAAIACEVGVELVLGLRHEV